MNTRELRAQAKKLIDQARAIVDTAEGEHRGQTTAEKERYEKLLADAKALRERADREDEQRSVELGLTDRTDDPHGYRVEPDAHRGRYFTPDGREVRMLAPNESFAQNVRMAPLPDGIQAHELDLGRWLRGVVTGDWSRSQAERRAMASAPDTVGGYMIPDPLSAQVIDLQRNQTRVLQAGARTIPMESGQLTFARVEGDVTAYWRGENQTITKSDVSLGALRLRLRTVGALTAVSMEYVEDAQNGGALIERSLAEALGLAADLAYLRGDNVLQPAGIRFVEGVQTHDAQGVASSPTHNDFSNAVQLLLAANAPDTGLAALYNSSVAGKLDRKIDGTGQPLQPLPSFAALRRLTTNQIPNDLDENGVGGAGALTEVYVGDFRRVMIGVKNGIRIEVFREPTEAVEKLQVWIRAFMRTDSYLERANQMCVIRNVNPT